MKLVLHSVSYAGLWRGQKYLTLEDFIEKASGLGFDGVEIMAKRPHASLLDMNKDARKRIKEKLDINKVECACLAGYTDFTSGMDSGLIPVNEMQISYVSDLAELASDLGCGLVRVFSGYECKDVSYWKQWDYCVKAIKECAKRAAAYNVTIGIQNHHDIGVDTRSMQEMIREIDEPNCKAMFDAWAPAIHGDDLKESARLMSDMMVYTTVADYMRLPRYKYMPNFVSYERQLDLLKAVPMGEGFIDYKTFFTALKDCGYDGYVAYEMCSEIQGGGSEENLDMYAKRFVEYMKQF